MLHRFAAFMIQNSTSAFMRLDAQHKIAIAAIPLPVASSSSAWRTTKKSLPTIDDSDPHRVLVEKVAKMFGLWTKDYPKLRYWIDKSKHEKGEIYPDATVGPSPTKKSDSREIEERSSDNLIKESHPQLEWDRSALVIEVVNVKEFVGLEDLSLEVLRKSTLAKKIAQLITYMIKNMASSGVHQVYGAVTCYSKWLFVKGEIIDDKDISFTLHNDVLPLEASGVTPCALSFLHAINTLVLKAAAEPKKLQNFHDVTLTLLRLDEGGAAIINSAVLACTGRSLILEAYWPPTNQLVCIKCNQGAVSVFDNEVQILKLLNAANVPNIPTLLSTGTVVRKGESYQAVVTDLVGKSIDKVLPMSAEEVRDMASDILEALTAMHRVNIVHSDVKPANIVRRWNEAKNRHQYYLIDFGFSFASGTITDGAWGCSIEYASVEMLKGNVPTFKDDLKALWYTVMHALMGQLPWQPLRMCSELTLWSKQGWSEELRELNKAPYMQLANLYDNIDRSEPHEAWMRYLCL
jgi:tRNA A-37 threonylcarbamoyl transferase component Bud32